MNDKEKINNENDDKEYDDKEKYYNTYQLVIEQIRIMKVVSTWQLAACVRVKEQIIVQKVKIIQKVKTSLWLSTLDTLVENVAKARMIEKQFLEGGMDALMAMAEAEMNGENGDQDSSSTIVNETSAVRVVKRKSLLTQRKNVSIQKRRRACIA